MEMLPETPTIQGQPLRRFTRVEYEKLIELGILGKRERVELMFGMVVATSPIDQSHSESVRRVYDFIRDQVADRARVYCQGPFAATDDSEPVPDCYVVPNVDNPWVGVPPYAMLVVEVALSSLRVDRKLKTVLYGIAEVDEYWIVDLVHGVVEVYRDRQDGEWQSITRHVRGEVIAMRALPDVRIAVADVLPPAA